jgi:hypothetical protein
MHRLISFLVYEAEDKIGEDMNQSVAWNCKPAG